MLNTKYIKWKLQVLLTKKQAALGCESMQAKQLGGKLFQGIQALGKSVMCSRQLAGDCYNAVPKSTGPSFSDLYTQYQFMCDMYWLTVRLLYMSTINKKIHQGGGNP